MATVDWIQRPYIHLPFVAARLYGTHSRLHIRKLQDRLKGRIAFQSWELEQLEALRKEIAGGIQRSSHSGN